MEKYDLGYLYYQYIKKEIESLKVYLKCNENDPEKLKKLFLKILK
jgi:hypothetical protein